MIKEVSKDLNKKLVRFNIDNKPIYSTGKRKNAVARVWIYNGLGKITVNRLDVKRYFTRELHVSNILKPFLITDTCNKYDVFCTVKGGGLTGQSGAILHGITKSLNLINPNLHYVLRHSGLLTRDSRVVERKKYGKHKARKSTQFSKR